MAFAAIAVAGTVTVIGVAAATGNPGRTAAAQTISCPDVASQLPAVPAAAQAEVTANLTLLQRQIAEANQRLVSTLGQGGPNFVQNAILGPLADKRRATIERIEIAIGRHAARPTGLETRLAACALGGGAANPAPAQPPAQPPAATTTAAPAANGRTISCPDVASQLPAVPAAAQAEVTANLTLLQRQIAEANQRLVSTLGQGGPNFVQNAILGPLADKRRATIERIEIAIGRHAARPTGLETRLAACALTG